MTNCELCGERKATHVIGLYPLANDDHEIVGMLDAMACGPCTKRPGADWHDVTEQLLDAYKETPPTD